MLKVFMSGKQIDFIERFEAYHSLDCLPRMATLITKDSVKNGPVSIYIAGNSYLSGIVVSMELEKTTRGTFTTAIISDLTYPTTLSHTMPNEWENCDIKGIVATILRPFKLSSVIQKQKIFSKYSVCSDDNVFQVLDDLGDISDQFVFSDGHGSVIFKEKPKNNVFIGDNAIKKIKIKENCIGKKFNLFFEDQIVSIGDGPINVNYSVDGMRENSKKRILVYDKGEAIIEVEDYSLFSSFELGDNVTIGQSPLQYTLFSKHFITTLQEGTSLTLKIRRKNV